MILDDIADKTRERVRVMKQRVSLNDIKTEALSCKVGNDFPFKKALLTKDISFICEVKKASPSKGIIAENFPYVEIAKSYEQAGASAVSVLTEPYYFKGDNKYLSEIKNNISLPVLRKDFTVDEYMLYEAKIISADAVLLICSLLSDKELQSYLEIADGLGLSAIVEAHDESEIIKALKANADIIGVNNRNLKDFTVDINNSIKLRKLVPSNIVYISESGIKTSADVSALKKNNTDAVLIGESFMKSENKKAELEYLRGDSVDKN